MAKTKKKKPDRQALLAKWQFFASSIPIHPRVLLMVTEMLSARFSSVTELEYALNLDPGLCLRIMRMAGSSTYRGITPHTPSQAIMRIGLERITEVVNQLFYRKTRVEAYGPAGSDTFEDIWAHSVLTSLAAVELKKRAGGGTAGVLSRVRYLGLVHDLGRLVFLAGNEERYNRMARGSVRGHLGSPAREHESYHITHQDLGGEVASKWNLGREVGWVLSAHHAPSLAPREFWTVPLVHLADWVAIKVQEDWIPDLKEPDRQAARALHLEPSDLRLAIAATHREWVRTLEFMEEAAPLSKP